MLRASQTENEPVQAGPFPAAKPQPAPRAARTRRRKAFLLGLVLALLAGLALPPLINISRYKRRVAASLSASLGRPVELGSVRLVLLPRPGFSISNFAVDELPQFGAEPLLQCPSVTASLRLFSLWRGRFEISRISLDEPSINLQRDAQGYWNFAPVLTQASRIPNAPTQQLRPGRNLRFPYIEATGARVNFKFGDEKLPFSLLNADTAVWLENPNEWRVRFRAQPMRTDMNFSAADTGVLRVDGAVRRAATLGALPLALDAQWEKAPLGQISRLLTGEDAGWRADLDLRAHIGGTPDQLRLHTTASARDFHRAEFEPMQSLQLAATCDGVYARETRLLSSLLCVAPAGGGTVRLTGTLASVNAMQGSALRLEMAHVSASAWMELLRHVRRGFAQNTESGGEANGQFEWNAATLAGASLGNGTLTGSAIVSGLTLQPPGSASSVSLPNLYWTAVPGTLPNGRGAQQTEGNSPALLLEPVVLQMGSATPLTIDGRLTAQEFAMHYSGAAALARLLPLSRAFGILRNATAGLAPAGDAQLNLTLAGPWITPVPDADLPTAPSLPSGTLGLRNAHLQTPYLRTPLIITAAQSSVTPGEIAWSGVEARLGSVAFTGNFRMPLDCAPQEPCPRHFDLSTAAIDVNGLRESLDGSAGKTLVGEWLSRVDTQPAPWPSLEGTVRAGRLSLGSFAAQNVTADVTLGEGRLEIASLDGRALGGYLHGRGDVSFSGGPSYAVRVQLTDGEARSVAALFGERWGAGGSVDLSANLKLQGGTAHALTQSAAGTVHWDWRDGGWVQLTGTPLGAFDLWTADGTLANGVLTLTRGLVTTNDSAEPVSGTVTWKRQIDLRVGSDLHDTVTGTFSQPVLTPAKNAE